MAKAATVGASKGRAAMNPPSPSREWGRPPATGSHKGKVRRRPRHGSARLGGGAPLVYMLVLGFC